MRLYREYPGASVTMHDNIELRTLLMKAIHRDEIAAVVESGTYLGLGSTTFIAESFPPDAPPDFFVTLEASWANWRRARRNLRRFPFVTCVWGDSLVVRDAICFVENDLFLRNHADREDIFIDDIDDPVGLYVRELRGQYGMRRASATLNPLYQADRIRHYRGEDLLAKTLREVVDRTPLIALDAAGGAGLMEFQTALRTMGASTYLLLLDDVHHVKHYRSLQQIKADPSFDILGVEEEQGWLLAKHR